MKGKILSLLLVCMMLLGAFGISVFAADAVVLGIFPQAEGLADIDTTVVITFDIAPENLANITVSKLAPNGSGTPVSITPSLSGSECTLTFAAVLDYGSQYKVTIPDTVAASEYVSLFNTLEEYQGKILTRFVDEGFEDLAIGGPYENTTDATTAVTAGSNLYKLSSQDAGGGSQSVSIKNATNNYSQFTKVLQARSHTRMSVTAVAQAAEKITGSYSFYGRINDTYFLRLLVSGSDYVIFDIDDWGSPNFRPGGANSGLGNGNITLKSDAFNKVDYQLSKVTEGANSYLKLDYAAINGTIIPASVNVVYKNVKNGGLLVDTIDDTKLRFWELSSAFSVASWSQHDYDNHYLYATEGFKAVESEISGANTISVIFNKKVDTATLASLHLADDDGPVGMSYMSSADGRTVTITAASNFDLIGKAYYLSASSLKDMAGESISYNYVFGKEGMTVGDFAILGTNNQPLKGKLTQGLTVKNRVVVAKNGDDPVDVFVAAALYDEDGSMVAVGANLETVTGDSATIDATLTIPALNSIKKYTLRGFVWDGNSKPLADRISYTDVITVPNNLIANAGFEDGLGGIGIYGGSGSTGNSISLVNSPTHSGGQAVYFNHGTNAWADAAYAGSTAIRDAIIANGAGDYTFTAWVKPDGPVTENLGVRVSIGLNGNTNYSDLRYSSANYNTGTPSETTPDGWMKFTVTGYIDMGANDVILLQVMTSNNGVGVNYYLDDVSFVKN